jgi:hypothetical protein
VHQQPVRFPYDGKVVIAENQVRSIGCEHVKRIPLICAPKYTSEATPCGVSTFLAKPPNRLCRFLSALFVSGCSVSLLQPST